MQNTMVYGGGGWMSAGKKNGEKMKRGKVKLRNIT